MIQEEIKNLRNILNEAKILADAEFERLCNNNNYTEAYLFQAIRDNVYQNLQLLQSYHFLKEQEKQK